MQVDVVAVREPGADVRRIELRRQPDFRIALRLLRAEPHFDLARRRTPELNQPYSSIDSSISMTGMSSSTM